MRKNTPNYDDRRLFTPRIKRAASKARILYMLSWRILRLEQQPQYDRWALWGTIGDEIHKDADLRPYFEAAWLNKSDRSAE